MPPAEIVATPLPRPQMQIPERPLFDCSTNGHNCRQRRCCLVATDADVATVTFDSLDSFVEFVVDTFNDVSFSFLPEASRRHQSTSAAELSTVDQLILLAFSADSNRSLSVYLVPDIDDDDSQLVIERRLRATIDRLNVSLSGLLPTTLCSKKNM